MRVEHNTHRLKKRKVDKQKGSWYGGIQERIADST
jgi:hypothetical protein